jgi:hypothetical protein
VKSANIEVNTSQMTANIEVTNEPKLVLVSEGKVRELQMPYSGKIVVKALKGKIKDFNIHEVETF